MTHLRIHLSLAARCRNNGGNHDVSRNASALQDFLPRPCREQTCLFRFFRGALALYLYIILRQPGVGTTEKTAFASRYSNALLNFSPHPCREQTCLFRFFSSALAHLRIHLSLVARFGTAEKTAFASCCVRALLNFSPHLIGSTVKGSRQLCCRGVELNPCACAHNGYQLTAIS